MKTVSWVLLALLGAATLVISLISAGVAYRAREDQIGPVKLEELAAGRAEVATALRARRGTAAAYAAGYGALFLAIALGPYRRGDRWAWWALLAGALVLSAVSLVRVPALGTRLGVANILTQLGIAVVALLLDVRRLRA
jgi:hypothetical protein